MPRNRANRRRSGFTLIELLCVIAIIAILSAMLMPTFSRVRELGRRTACQSNMKQLGLAFIQYTQDYDGHFPGAGQVQKWASGGHWVAGPCNNTNPAGSSACLLADATTQVPTGLQADITDGAIFPFVKNTQIYICPSITEGQTKGLTYSMNCAIGGIGEAQVIDSAETVLLVDEAKANDAYFYCVNSVNSTDSLTTIHNNGGNLALADGHVKFYPYNSFVLDNTAIGQFNKTNTAGVPHFYDTNFGPAGYYAGVAVFGSCASP